MYKMNKIDKLNKLNNLINSFFNKKKNKTSHETLANYNNNILIPGGKNGNFYTHICYHTITKALVELVNLNKKYYTIVETGCSAHGTKSTLLWDKFVNIYGGKVISVDLNKKAVDLTNKQTSEKTIVYHSNSLKFLPSLSEKIDFLYLDSYDVNFLNPLPSAKHHLKEFNCIKNLLHKDSIILIDDTPICCEWLDNGKNNILYNKLKNNFNKNMSGKGSLINKELNKMNAKKILHQYQILWKI